MLPEIPVRSDEPSTLAAGVDGRLDPQYVPLQRLVGWIVTACFAFGLMIGVAIIWLTGELPRWANLLLLPSWLIATVAIAWFSYRWPVRVYQATSYMLDDRGIEIRGGVYWRSVTSVPRTRVQHIDVSQGPMERSFGLGRLVIHTAGTDHSRVELPGLSHPVALAIRNHLLPQGSDDAI